MNIRKNCSLCFVLFVLSLFPSAFGQDAWKGECARTADLKIYSGAFTAEQTGDLEGYELAIDERKGPSASVRLYVYEGAASEGIDLPGHITSDKLVVQGNWVEHLIEYPSKKEVVQTHFVKISGTLTPSLFEGNLTIESMEKNQAIKLRRVKRIWMCK
jgi:hypothetical protein